MPQYNLQTKCNVGVMICDVVITTYNKILDMTRYYTF